MNYAPTTVCEICTFFSPSIRDTLPHRSHRQLARYFPLLRATFFFLFFFWRIKSVMFSNTTHIGQPALAAARAHRTPCKYRNLFLHIFQYVKWTVCLLLARRLDSKIVCFLARRRVFDCISDFRKNEWVAILCEIILRKHDVSILKCRKNSWNKTNKYNWTTMSMNHLLSGCCCQCGITHRAHLFSAIAPHTPMAICKFSSASRLLLLFTRDDDDRVLPVSV